jgi:hypothetical protein
MGMLGMGVAGLLCPPAIGEIISTGGGVVLIEPPPSVRLGALDSISQIRAFNEQSFVTLATHVELDATEPGHYVEPGDLTPATIPMGTLVHSHLMHFAPNSSGFHRVEGSATFAHDIMGVIVFDDTLNASRPLLGWPATLYPMGGKLEVGTHFGLAADTFTIEADGRTLRVSLSADSGPDHIRVITTTTSVSLFGDGRPNALSGYNKACYDAN